LLADTQRAKELSNHKRRWCYAVKRSNKAKKGYREGKGNQETPGREYCRVYGPVHVEGDTNREMRRLTKDDPKLWKLGPEVRDEKGRGRGGFGASPGACRLRKRKSRENARF